jgi:hypothetical protein
MKNQVTSPKVGRQDSGAASK